MIEVLAPSEKELNFWNSNLAHLMRIDISPQNQLWDTNKYKFSESALLGLLGASTGGDHILSWPSKIAYHPVKVLAIVIFGLSSLT